MRAETSGANVLGEAPSWCRLGRMTIRVEAPPTHCSQCGAEYRNIQHPLKPPGVIMQRVCDCTPVTTTQQVGDNATVSVTTLVPPDKK